MADLVWRECVKWLIRCQILPADHRVAWQNAEVKDLVNTLRDGVLLCQLLNKLQPGCIDLKDIALRPQLSQFLCLRNIKTFLHTCQNVFELKPSELFEPLMLFDCTDFGQVLHTLSQLSKSSKAQSNGIRGFPSFSKAHDYYNDDIYRNLEDIANEEFGDYDHGYYSSVNQDEDIYEDLCSFQRRGTSQIPLTPTAPMEKRDYCIRELVETEKNYIEALNMIMKHFMRPLKSVIKEEDRSIIFRDIKELAEIHTGFHSDLYKACTSSQYKISECFLHWKDQFIVYGDYCSNLPKAQELVDELCTKNEIINQSILRCQVDANEGKFKLRDLLSVPMQRILKYHLLLKELLRNTPKSHDDYAGLEKALDAMLDLAQYINEVKRDSETLQIIDTIQASITDLCMPGNLKLKDYGRLLKDGELKIRSHDDNKIKNRYIFVFDKVMLMCKSTKMMDKLLGGEQYSYKEAIVLAEYKVEDANNAKAGCKDKWNHFWFLVHSEKTTAFTMYAKTEEMKRKWIEAIERALDNGCPEAFKSTDHAFDMHSFEKPTRCADCDKLLRGLFFQGYLCQRCGVAVHKCCISTVRSCGAPSLPPRPLPSSLAINNDESVCASPLLLNGHRPLMGKVRAKCQYRSSGGVMVLSLEPDDVIFVLRKINDTWWEGILQRTGQEGRFPVDCVEEVEMPKRDSYEDPSQIPGATHAITSPNPNEGYVNLNLEEYPWFAGEMDRDTATTLLEKLPCGTFLLRISHKQKGGFAISLNYNNQVKHMRVCVTTDGQHFYLSETKFFKSILELIHWYEENSLSESFSGLNTTLVLPYRNAINAPAINGASSSSSSPIGFAIAIHDYVDHSPYVLSFHKGDRLAILSKDGSSKGWWKGQIDDRVGYFPMTYVSEDEMEAARS